MTVKFLNRFCRNQVVVDVSEPSLTSQEFKDDVDVNSILRKYTYYK